MNENYKTPDSKLNEEESTSGSLASRWNRLTASIIDSLILSVITVPLMFAFGVFSESSLKYGNDYKLTMTLSLLMVGVFFAINGRFLSRDGQTVGKKALGIKIVTLEDGHPSFQNNLIPRYAVFFLAGLVPVIGSIFSLANILFIFRSDKRCVHDLFGKTKVVDC